jgi:hypothetical protein
MRERNDHCGLDISSIQHCRGIIHQFTQAEVARWRIRIAVTTPIKRQYAPLLGNQWQNGPKNPARSTPSGQQ